MAVTPYAGAIDRGFAAILRYFIAATPNIRDAACNAALYLACWAGRSQG
jgi:hypothetical protein